MTVTTVLFQDVPALALETSCCRVLMLPGQGGKIASFCRDGREYLWRRDEPVYRPLTLAGRYTEAACSGYDDCFPTIDPYEEDGRTYLDHGEVCRRPCRVFLDKGVLRARTTCEGVPASFERRYSESANGGLHIDFTVENLSDRPLPFLWAAHLMLRAEPGARAVVPYPDGTQAETTFCADGRVPSGKRFAFPYAADGRRMDESEPVPGSTRKYYFPDPLPAGRLGYRYPDGREFVLRFDPNKTPFAGLWFCDACGLPCEGFAPELCTAPFDRPDAAARRGYRAELNGRETLTFWTEMDVLLPGEIKEARK